MAHGRDILLNARLNKGTAFTEHEREALGLMGLLPDGVSAPADQLLRVKRQMQQCTTDLDKYVYLSELADHNERLFFTMLRSDPAGLMPLVYTPTVGEACQKFGHIMRRPRGLYVGLNRKGRIRQVLENWPEDDVRFIVVTDGERILGLGDQGVCGMGIPIGKLALYSAFGGVPPEAALPVTLDVGTNNEAFLEDPLYPGLRQRRITGPEYDAFVEEFVMAVQQVFPRCCIQFEDFTNKTAIPLLQRYRERVCCFNDDIQGTAAVAVAGMLGACRIRGDRLRDHRIVFYGAGSAAIGIADLCCLQMTREGLSMAEARARCFLMNSKGLVTADSPGLSEHQQPYAHANPPMRELLEVVKAIKPSAIVGVSTVAGAFTPAVIQEMARLNERPVIFPYSNPTSKSECTAKEAIEHSAGRAIFASGSPFPPLHHAGKLFVPGQGNNVYIYPAVGLAVYVTQASRVTDDMFLRAAESLAEQVTDEDLRVGLIYPPVAEIHETLVKEAIDVATMIFDKGLARVPRPTDIAAFVRAQVYDPTYPA
ncbi:MAG: NAD-dependent malic enzyme [Planctomycetaceae bacterium]|jgi:malate dehydrogenase (oxaloacetate-decarboxylating)(NADP+)|nr:NAD-dependent malic enzyme [Planctomycetaceae bacterium]